MHLRDALQQDLIETLWNVKTIAGLTVTKTKQRFNRDIVECKGAIGSELAMRQRRFNRDIVECKGVYYNKLMGEISGFNRDIVECKDRALNIAVTSRKGRVSRNSAIRFAA